MVFRQEIRISKDRIAVLIGTKGKEKKELEKLAKARITVDSNEGDVILEGEDSVELYILKEVVKAIGRGFSPEEAKLLFDENYMLELLDIKDYIGKSPKKIARLKARLIGTQGKARKIIEELTNTKVVIYGKTVGIIGKVENAQTAREAVEYILDGAPHGHVFKFLERKRAETRNKGFENEFPIKEAGE